MKIDVSVSIIRTCDETQIYKILEDFSITMQGNLNLASTLLEHINIALTFYLQNIHTLHFVISNVNVL